jgi:hypothetical protein
MPFRLWLFLLSCAEEMELFQEEFTLWRNLTMDS